MQDTNEYYLINQLSLITGLTDRTLRNYIPAGILEGEKVNGTWHFTIEQIEAFITHPSVRPSILAKNNSLVYDFLIERHEQRSEMCVILDIPGKNKNAISSYFCDRISNEDFHNIRFSFDGISDSARVILKGSTEDVQQLVNGFTHN